MKKRIVSIIMFVLLLVCISSCQISIPDFSGDPPVTDDSKTPSNSDEKQNDDSGNPSQNVNPSAPSEEETHVCEFSEVGRTAPTCTAQGTVNYRCTCGESYRETLDVIDHDIEAVAEIPSTCVTAGHAAGKRCKVCGEMQSGGEELKLTPHTSVVDEAVAPTENSVGKTEGAHCGVCGKTLVKQNNVFFNDYSNPSRYASAYALEYLSAQDKGSAYADLYERIDTQMHSFHLSETDVDESLVVAKVNYSDLGISDTEAVAVWSAYRMDHPLFYWMSSQIKYTQDALNILVFDEYSLAETRALLNSSLYKVVSDIVENSKGKNIYELLLAFHDDIILRADYAYKSDGVTPEDATFAHNVIGVLIEESGVCESYAKAFQLLMNYCSVENILVTGFAGEEHAWNLVKLDDGEWYWFDLTWDDTPDRFLGVAYNYFCVNDDQSVGWIDGPWSVADSTFSTSHFPDSPSLEGTSFMYELPMRSSNIFTESEILVRKTLFTVDGLTYSVCGSGVVQLVEIGKVGSVVIPDTVSYDGNSYNVVSVGALNETDKSLYYIDTITDRSVTDIKIGKNVRFIWDMAFSIPTLKSITVDEYNTSFSSIEGALYTKGLYTLIQYPSASETVSYSTPTETVQIAYGAFRDVTYLSSLVIGKGVSSVGILNGGYGYNDSDELRSVTTYGGEFAYISYALKNGSLTLEEGNSVFKMLGGAIYSLDGTKLYAVVDIGLESFTVEESVVSFDNLAFYFCVNLSEIIYNGDLDSWEKIEKGTQWSPYFGCKLRCINGLYQINAQK